MEERDKVQVEAKSLLKERNSENNNEWGTKSLLKERKEEVDHSKAEAKGATFSPKSLLCSQVTEYAFA